MKKIIITITPSGLMFYANGIVLFAMNPPEIVSEKLFLKTINEAKSFCLN
jgi:hypothetical protein